MKHILVVDDSETVREVLAITLETFGDYAVEQAADGQAAIEMLEKNPEYDLVLTDLDMPLMGGDELIEWMKSREETKNIPIIVLTAGVDKIRQELAQRFHIEGMLSKPFRPQQLGELVNRILK